MWYSVLFFTYIFLMFGVALCVLISGRCVNFIVVWNINKIGFLKAACACNAASFLSVHRP